MLFFVDTMAITMQNFSSIGVYKQKMFPCEMFLAAK